MIKFKQCEHLYFTIGIIACGIALLLRDIYSLDPQDTGFVWFMITIISYNLLKGKLVSA